MQVVTQIFAFLTEITQAVITWVGDSINGIGTLFYDATTSQVTILGGLTLAGLGVGFVFFMIRWISNLVKIGGSKRG